MKKHISIIGTCCSREIFNNSILQSIFDIDLYVFKNNPFSFCDSPESGLNLPKEIINKLPAEEFIKRNIEYDINKSAIKELLSKNSEYVIVDLYSFCDPIYKVSYNDKATFISTNNFDYYNKLLIETCNKNGLTITCDKIQLSDIDQNIVIGGIIKFAHFLNEHYNNIIINNIKPTHQYFDLDNNIKPFDYKKFDYNKKNIDIVEHYTNILVDNVHNPKILNWDESFVSRVIYPTDIPTPPNMVHLLNENYENLALQLLKLLDISYNEYWTNLMGPFSYSYELLQNKFQLLQYKYENLKKSLYCNINTYTNWLSTLKHHLICFCCHADMQNKIKHWHNKNILGLNFNVGFRESYIGIIDTKNNYTFETNSNEEISFIYEIPNVEDKIYIKSNGFYATSDSSIIYKNKEYSKQKRGVNIFVLDLVSNEIIDQAHCDTCLDDELRIDSSMLSIFN